jgi:hypothetical protein
MLYDLYSKRNGVFIYREKGFWSNNRDGVDG